MLTFLSASVPLTKTYTKLPDGSIEKTSYPNVWEVTSHAERFGNLTEFEVHLRHHAELGHCLLKGEVTRQLVNESRKDSTDRNATTTWLCLDIDGVEAESVEEVMKALGLSTTSYIIQWSGSQNISGTGLRCHIFILLTRPVSAPLIKQWLIQKNHEVHLLRNHQALTKTGNSLTWGLDITACQSDKLIYIAPPVLKNIKNPLGKTPRISLVRKAQDTFEFPSRVNSIAQNRELTDKRVLELREAAGLQKRKLTYKVVGAHEIMVKPDACIVTEMKQDRGFVYFNLNGGDSWAYYHPENNPKFIYNFKGEPTYLTAELLPSYWEQLKGTAYRTDSNGLTFLAFLEKRTSTYWRGTYDESKDILDIYPAKTETMVRHFADANGLPLGESIPEWEMVFEPLSEVRVDFKERKINTFQPTDFMRPAVKKTIKCPPTVFRVIEHVLAKDVESIEHFMNWLAFIAQKRERTMTAWVFQGTQGTGKGLLMNKILVPIFGVDQTVIKRAAELSEKWTDFVAGKFIVFIDEVQTSAYRDEHSMIANLKNFITEPTITVRMMNKNSYAVQNYTNWLFASNKPDPVSVDKEDRRFNIGPYQANKLEFQQRDLEKLQNELQEFYWYLMSYPLDERLAATPLSNSSRSTLIALSQSTSESTASAIQEGNFGFFLDALPTGTAYTNNPELRAKVEGYQRVLLDIMNRTRPDGSCNLRRDELFVMFDYAVGGMSPSPTMFTRFLGHRQLEIKPVNINGKVERGISVTWQKPDGFAKVIAEQFKDFTTPKVTK